MADKIRVGVLFGGQSGEHEVSLVSARAVLDGLDTSKYEVVPIGITKDGRWLAGPDPLAALEAAADPKLLPGGPTATTKNQEPLRPGSPSTLRRSLPLSAAKGSGQAGSGTGQARTESLIAYGSAVEASGLSAGSQSSVLGSIDVIFPVLHGPMGEDGTVQGLMELAGVPYVGCGVLAAAVGMDKAMMKAAFAAAGLAQVPWLLVRRTDWRNNPEYVAEQVEAQLRYPMFVKPANMGSSVGITKAIDRATLLAGLAESARYDRRIVIEQGINAREIEISVLGNDDVDASVPGEIVPSNEWYDYEAKYLGGESEIRIPAPIPAELAEEVRELAIRAFKAIDGAGLARVDFLLDRDTDELYLNEANTMPGFTPISMYAQMWEASGLPYRKLLDRLIELAIERHKGQ